MRRRLARSALSATAAADVSVPAACRGNGVLTAVWPHVPQLRGYLRKRLPASEVDDLVQDIFVRLIHRVDGAEVQYPQRYLYQVATAALIDRHRHEKSRCGGLHCELLEAELPHDEVSPDRVLAARQGVQAAQRVLAALPERTRAILVAVRVDGASLKTVAAHQGITVSAVEKHLIRAIRALRIDRDAA
ncbi:sigma-70 family RNA polymerase sigma factor [Phenylobacterium sp.]|uniref:RNA polymerase sigma factor n=1 Tax=Phenylobacterium sp. TaxID=1871053 RepID=UPI0025E6452C|nr:sigma-70 family RNA polymerase sigma factor [Phenylobacterium sp.]